MKDLYKAIPDDNTDSQSLKQDWRKRIFSTVR